MADKKGYVYVLSNPSMPNLVKIGRSKHGGRVRAEEIYKKGGTGVPSKFNMEFEIWCEDSFTVESDVHCLLAESRVNNGREFFKVSTEDAKLKIIEVLCSEYGLDLCMPDFCITESDMRALCSQEVVSAAKAMIPDLPAQLGVASAIKDHISEFSIIAAIREYRKACARRKKLIDNPKGGNS